MKVLLVSTYELGGQPLGLAVPAGLLRAAGHEVRTADLAVEDWPASDLAWAEAAAFSVPMHTALRLALGALERVRRERPGLAVALHGLYAPVAAELGVLGPGELASAGDPAEVLSSWLASLGAPQEAPAAVRVELGPARPAPGGAAPDRRGLPSLDRYARLLLDGAELVAGSLEASRGCNHRCLHCPVPIVWEGRSRAVPIEDVLADLDALVELGARHVSFTDPDFLNRPAHARAIAAALNERHPALSFDATIKVSHLVRHASLLPELAACGLAFVVSAFESTSAEVLARLDKGHAPAEESEAVRLLRAVGVEVRPSLMPFTPWTTRDDLVELLDFVAAHDLVDNVDPVQYSIRLLLPPGSLLLSADDPVLAASLGAYDPAALGYRWRSADPVLDELQLELGELVERAEAVGEDPGATYAAVRAAVFGALGRPDPGPPGLLVEPGPPGRSRPRLSESWFCCAESTARQLAPLGASASLPLSPCRSPKTPTSG